MKKPIIKLLSIAIAVWVSAVSFSDSVSIGWNLPPGPSSIVTNQVVFEAVTNTVTVYPNFTGFAIYYSPILLPNLSGFMRVTNAAPNQTNITITGLPNGSNKFICITATNLVGVESAPSNLIQLGAPPIPTVPGLVAR